MSVKITELPAASVVEVTDVLPIVDLTNPATTKKATVQQIIDLVPEGSGAPTDASYVTLGTNGDLDNERVLTAGDGITFNDAGAGSTLTVHAVRGTCTIEQFAVDPETVGNGITSANAAFALAIAALTAGTYGTLLLGSDRSYLLTAAHTVPASCSIIGQGATSVLKTSTDAAVLVIGGEDVTLSNFTILGSQSGSSQTGIKVGDTASAGSGVSRLMISDVFLKDLGANGFEYNQNPLAGGAATYQGPLLNNVMADRCAVGFRLGERGEYINFTNCVAQRCTSWGFVLGAGNFALSNCKATANANGCDIPNSTNGAHGSINGCSFNHNATILVRYSSILGQKFVGCEFYQGATGGITIGESSQGCDFIGCTIDVASVVVEATTSMRMSNCRYDTSYGNVWTVNDTSEIIIESPLTLGNDLPSELRTFIQRGFTFASDDNDTLTAQESFVPTLIVASGTITTPRQITNPRASHVGNQQRIVNNNAEDITFKWSGGATVTIATGEWAVVGSDGTDAIKLAWGDATGSGGSAPAGTGLVTVATGSFGTTISYGSANTVLTSTGSAGSWATIVNANVNASAAIAASKLTPPGSTTQVLYNLSGAFAASSGFIYDSAGGITVTAFVQSPVLQRSSSLIIAGTDATNLYVGSSTSSTNAFTNVRINPSAAAVLGIAGVNHLEVASGDVLLKPGNTEALRAVTSALQIYLPRHGSSTAFASEGAVSLSAASPVTLNSSQYSRAIIIFSSSGDTATFPHPSSADRSYVKFCINQDVSDEVTLSTGTGATATLLASETGTFAFTNSGVYQVGGS